MAIGGSRLPAPPPPPLVTPLITHIDPLRTDEGAIKKDYATAKKSLRIISLVCCVLCLVLFLVQIALQLSFCMLVLIWFFASYQILSKGCMSTSQDFLGCTTTKKVEEHWIRLSQKKKSFESSCSVSNFGFTSLKKLSPKNFNPIR